MTIERIERELALLREGNQVAELVGSGQMFVVYRDVPTGGRPMGLPEATDVIVQVPSGYPAAMIDLAGLPVGSPLLTHVKGGQNSQGLLVVEDRQWQFSSYHPHNGGGGPPWDQMRHGFHTYLDHLITWLHRLS